MPRKSGRKKPAIGEDTGAGTSMRSYSRGVGLTSSSTVKGINAQPSLIHEMVQGGKAISFSTFDPVVPNRTKIMQFSYSDVHFGTFSSTQTSNASWLSAFTGQMAVVTGALTDNIARAYANAQNLQISTPADVFSYVNTYAIVYGDLALLSAVTNGDAYNDQMQRLAQVGIPYRAQIQTAWDRLQTLPIPPGVVDICERLYGAFSVMEGGDVILTGTSAVSGGGQDTPYDLGVAANWQTILNNINSQLVNLTTTAIPEIGITRILFTEMYGAPIPLKADGVKICRSLYDMHRLQGVSAVTGANIFAFPYVVTGSTTPVSNSVPVIIPKGYEKDPIWSTLFRPEPFWLFNNVVSSTTSQTALGVVFKGAQLNGTMRWYQTLHSTSNTSQPTTVMNGYTDPMIEMYWWPLVANSEATGYASDVRSQNDMTLFNISMDIIAGNTIELSKDIFLRKSRIPLPSDCKSWTTGSISGPRR